MWMQAQSIANATGGRIKSNGRCLTVSELRANQLADRLSKHGALESALRTAADQTIKQAGAVLAYHAALRVYSPIHH